MSLFLVRHGATEWSESGRHTSHTDLPLLPHGEEEAEDLAGYFADQEFALVLTSPMERARHTAELVGFPHAEVTDDLREWDYGDYEGLTRAQIRERDPAWTIWTGPTPGGETADDVAARLDRLIERVRAVEGDVLAFTHGHTARALGARWVGEPPSFGRALLLDTATVSVLALDRGDWVIQRWNA